MKEILIDPGDLHEFLAIGEGWVYLTTRKEAGDFATALLPIGSRLLAERDELLAALTEIASGYESSGNTLRLIAEAAIAKASA